MATAFTYFDTRSVVLRTLQELGLAVAEFARLQSDSPVPAWLLQRRLKGDRPLRIDEAQRLENLCRELRSLHEESALPINFRDASRVRAILVARRMADGAGQRALGCDGSDPI